MEDLITHALKISERTLVERESDIDSKNPSNYDCLYRNIRGFIRVRFNNFIKLRLRFDDGIQVAFEAAFRRSGWRSAKRIAT